ncbi:MAG: hypothetical protein HUJ53_07755 [Holdemanella sp.]|nr:hypothetical protein [Holdemanella sp.]
MEISEQLFEMHIHFSFTTKEIYTILGLEEENETISMYSLEIRQRIKTILCEQMRKYKYLF